VTAAREDPLVKHARREAVLALSLWLMALIYTLTYCHFYGYDRPIEGMTFVLWFPDWVFWGIVVPWGVCIVLSGVFAYAIMGDDTLGESHDSTTELPGEADEVPRG